MPGGGGNEGVCVTLRMTLASKENSRGSVFAGAAGRVKPKQRAGEEPTRLKEGILGHKTNVSSGMSD